MLMSNVFNIVANTGFSQNANFAENKFTRSLATNKDNDNITTKSPLNPALKPSAEVWSSAPNFIDKTVHFATITEKQVREDVSNGVDAKIRATDKAINGGITFIDNMATDDNYRGEVFSKLGSDFVMGVKTRTKELIESPTKIITDPYNLFADAVNEGANGFVNGVKTTYKKYNEAKNNEHVYAMTEWTSKTAISSGVEIMDFAAAAIPGGKVFSVLNKRKLKKASQDMNTAAPLIKIEQINIDQSSKKLNELAKNEIAKKMFIEDKIKLQSNRLSLLNNKLNDTPDKVRQFDKTITDLPNNETIAKMSIKERKQLSVSLKDKTGIIAENTADLILLNAGIKSSVKTIEKSLSELSSDKYSKKSYFNPSANKMRNNVHDSIVKIEDNIAALTLPVNRIKQAEADIISEINLVNANAGTSVTKIKSGNVRVRNDVNIKSVQTSLNKVADKLDNSRLAMKSAKYEKFQPIY